jgi:hypothetical protein
LGGSGGICILLATVGEGVVVIVRIGIRDRIELCVSLGGCGAGSGTTSASDVALELS